MRSIALALLAGGLLVGRSVFGAAYYADSFDDVDFGIHADAPAGTTICVPNESGGHGFFVPLEDSAQAIDCEPARMGARLVLYIEYNVAYEARSTGELAAHVCAQGRYKESPFRIDRARVVQCVTNPQKPRLNMNYVVLRPYKKAPGHPDGGLDQPDAELGVALVCPAGNCDRYSGKLKELFASIRSIPLSLEGHPASDWPSHGNPAAVGTPP